MVAALFVVGVALAGTAGGASAQEATPATPVSDGSATVVGSATPSRGTPVNLGPSVPPPALDPGGAMGDPNVPDDLALPGNSGEGRRIVYSKSVMRIWAIDEFGQVVKTHRVSGKEGVPYPGTYHVYSRSYSTFATHNPSIIWNYMVRFASTPRGGNVGFHEIPTQCVGGSCHKLQTVDQLGQALSGGCVRQSVEDAIWIWNWADVGTTVVVVD
jgi:hypothetical protein